MGRFTIGMFSPLGPHSFKSEYKLGLQLATEKIIVMKGSKRPGAHTQLKHTQILPPPPPQVYSTDFAPFCVTQSHALS